jgi:NAD(P)H-dependent FMN reductase
MSKLKIKLIVGSTRANRFSEKPAQWMFDLAKARADFDLERLDLRDYELPFFEEPLPPGFAKPTASSSARRSTTTAIPRCSRMRSTPCTTRGAARPWRS